VEWADVVGNEADEDSHAEESDEKSDGGDEKASAWTVRDGGSDKKANAREVEEEKKSGDYKSGKEEEDECAGSDFHLSIETLKGAGCEGEELRERGRQGILTGGERGHDFAVQGQVKLVKASSPSYMLGRRAPGGSG
jgi:hypothetical protein